MQVSECTSAHEGNNEGLQSRLMFAKQISECTSAHEGDNEGLQSRLMFAYASF